MARQAHPQPARQSPTVVVLLVLILIALLLGGAAAYYFGVYVPAREKQGVKGGQREAAALQGSLNQMTEEEIDRALDQIIEEGMFRICIASKVVVLGDGTAELRIENNLQNRYVMQVTLYLDETGEEIYRTDLIDPGYYIQSAKLDKRLDQGEYAATAVFTALYPDTEETVGTAAAQVDLYVLPPDVTPTPQPTASPTAAPTAGAR